MPKFAGGAFPRVVALFPLLFPLYFFRGTFLGVPVTLPEVFLGILAVWFLLEIWRGKYEFRLREWKLWPVLLFLAAAVCGILVVPEVATMVDGTEFPAYAKALGIFKGWILAPILYFVIARTVFREKPSLIPVALRALLFSGAVLGVMAIKQVITSEFVTLDGRASGPFESANYLSLYLGPLVVYAGLAFLESKKISARIFLGSCGVFTLFGLYFSQSYAAWLAVLAALTLAGLLFIRKKGKKAFWIAFAGLFVLGAGLVLSQIGSEKFSQFLEFSERSSSSVRIQVYEISFALLRENPLLGIGLGQFEQQYQEVAVTVLGQAPFEWNMLHPHNIFLAFWLNMGFFGLVAFIWLCGRAFLWLTESDEKERHLAALMLVVILVHGLFDTPYFKNDLAFQFWLLLAMLI